MVGRLLSYWEGNISGAMLNFGRVLLLSIGSWLANRDPYFMVYEKLPMHLGSISSPIEPNQPGFFLRGSSEYAISKVSFIVLVKVLLFKGNFQK